MGEAQWQSPSIYAGVLFMDVEPALNSSHVLLKTDSSSLSLGAGWCLLDVKGLVHYAENSLSFEKLHRDIFMKEAQGGRRCWCRGGGKIVA